jgi:tetratricopeptide (TPR) repeat protein
LAWALATARDRTLRDVPEAIQLAERACKQSNNSQAAFLDTLGVAYGAAGRFEDAIGATKQAVKAAEKAAQPAVVQEMQKRLELYREGRAYEP